MNKMAAVLISSALGCGVGAAELKVLMIGNSFSQSVLTYLPSMVRKDPEHRLMLTNAYIGGCPLERHWNNLEAGLTSPELAPYRIVTRFGDPGRNQITEKGNLPELIRREKWDIITIQQASHASWDYSTYQPYADRLISYIRANAPQAEILVHQTWAYRPDNPRLAKWKFDQAGMHRRLSRAYAQLAGQYRLRVIPVGDAVAIYRKTTTLDLTPPAAEALARLKDPELPPPSNDPVGAAVWRRDPENPGGPRQLRVDTIHLNARGAYLQAAVWYSMLFGVPATEIKYTPSGLSRREAAFLRSCAQQAVENYRQVTAGGEQKGQKK